MRIAILSMQRVINFGSVLQAYSLREMIREVSGETAVFLDIEQEPCLKCKTSHVKEIAENAGPRRGELNLLQRGKWWITRRLSKYNKRLIRGFMQSVLCLNEGNNDREYDCVVIGSDEVFNHEKGIRLQLHGEVKQAKKAITYAASCGQAKAENIADGDVKRVKKAMENLSAVSVRDDGTQRYVETICGKKTERHMDPVLMGPLHARKPGRVPIKRFLLVYAYGQRIHLPEEIEAIRAFAKEKGLLTVAVGGTQHWCDLYLPVSPMRALDYFSAAEYVVTDTFHGVIFSVVSRSDFAVFVRRSNENKLVSLLKELGLTNRIITDTSGITQVFNEKINYEYIDTLLKKEREKARKYLKEQLAG